MFRLAQRLFKNPLSSASKQFSTQNKHPIRDEILSHKTEYGNVPEKILELVDRKLYLNPKHPLGIVNKKLEEFFANPDVYKSKLQEKHKLPYKIVRTLSPIVTPKQNFDDLLVPTDHVSRKKSENYFINENLMLRAHTSAHQNENIVGGAKAYINVADVYRRDTIDATHYPCFHQMEGIRIFKRSEIGADQDDLAVATVVNDLKETLESLFRSFFGEVPIRWVPAYFPFTHPSFELEMYFKDQWVEMLGCGLIHSDLMTNCKVPEDEIGWALGIGLERFAMKLFDIPDIRLFWSEDQRFLSQFESGEIVKFKPYSKYPSCLKDVTFWIPDINAFEENDIFEIVRGVAGDLVESIDCIDQYHDKKRDRHSRCYRIHYRSLDRTLTNEEIDTLQFRIRDELTKQLKVELR